MLACRPEAVGLAREVGLADRLQPPSTASASLWTRGALRPMPKGHVMGVPGTAAALADVLSEGGPRPHRARRRTAPHRGRRRRGRGGVRGGAPRPRGRRPPRRTIAGRRLRGRRLPHLPALGRAPALRGRPHHTSLTEAVRALQGRTATSPRAGPSSWASRAASAPSRSRSRSRCARAPRSSPTRR
ncbi:hypothetical protein LV779_10345 [Streptomyces thinghirensis]|nr:hypothetical protein [Streptomyces thinghirensis]